MKKCYFIRRDGVVFRASFEGLHGIFPVAGTSVVRLPERRIYWYNRNLFSLLDTKIAQNTIVGTTSLYRPGFTLL